MRKLSDNNEELAVMGRCNLSTKKNKFQERGTWAICEYDKESNVVTDSGFPVEVLHITNDSWMVERFKSTGRAVIRTSALRER